MRYKFLCISLIGFLFSACSSKTTFTPIEPGTLSIAFTPAVAHFAPVFNRCGNSLGSTAIIGEEIPANYLSLDNTDIALRWGAPPLENSQAFVIIEDRLVLITHANNPFESLKLQEIVTLYTQNGGSGLDDAGLLDLEPMAYPEGSDIQQAFLNLISVTKVRSPNIRIVPDPAAMIEVVSENENAVGIIPLSALSSSVREIPIRDLPDTADTVQVLAMTKGSPTSIQIAWINCIQNSPGK